MAETPAAPDLDALAAVIATPPAAPASGAREQGGFRDPAFTANRNAPVHRWAPWIAGYSKHFVEDALARHAAAPSVVLDPFAGVGATLVEADLAGHEAIGFEINPYAAFASRVKLQAHHADARALRCAIDDFEAFGRTVESGGVAPRSAPPSGFRTRTPFYSAKVLHKVLLALDFIDTLAEPLVRDIFMLAFAATMVDYSNYSYEPSLGRKAAVGRPNVVDSPVFDTLAAKLRQMADDVEWHRATRAQPERPDGRLLVESFFDGYQNLPAGSVDLIVTSPPYLNNYHYNRNTRPHLYWLGFCTTPDELKRLEDLNFGAYWQNARELDAVELSPAVSAPPIQEAIAAVRAKNPDRGIYGGNGWANYAARYFNDCGRFVEGMRWCLRKDGTALVVVGNSILQGVSVPTDEFLALIAKRNGLRVAAIHTPRDTRVGSSIVNSRVPGSGRLYESVVEIHA